MQLRTLFHGVTREAEVGDGLEVARARWRRETHAVAEAYRGWLAAPRDQRWLAYVAYEAALEREEGAANHYRRRVEHVGARGRPHE
jgi:hypothetical protein